MAEARIGRLSSSQREFVTIQCKKNSLIELGKRRNGEENALLRRLQNKLKHSPRDMSKLPKIWAGPSPPPLNI